MQVLVTGASGFIGSGLVKKLSEEGFEVKVLLRKTSSQKNLEGLKYSVVYGDLQDFDSLKKAVVGVDYIFHLAGAIFAKNKAEFLKHNAQGTENLARACAENLANDKNAKQNFKRFVYVSSLAAAGPAREGAPRIETDNEKPVSFYGESKLVGEKKLFEHANDFSVSIVRPPAVFGPKDKGVLEFIKLAKGGIVPKFPTQGSKQKMFSVIYVDDLIDAIYLAGVHPKQKKEEVYFISGDGYFSWEEMMGIIASSVGRKIMFLPIPNPVLSIMSYLQSFAGRVLNRDFPLTVDKAKELRQDYWTCSNEKAKRVLSYSPKWKMKEAMDVTVKWYRDNKWI